jgi:hypothetical protein
MQSDEARLVAKPWYLADGIPQSLSQVCKLTGLRVPRDGDLVRASLTRGSTRYGTDISLSAKLLVARSAVPAILASMPSPRISSFRGYPLEAAGEFWDTPDNDALQSFIYSKHIATTLDASSTTFLTVFVDLTHLRKAVIYIYWSKITSASKGKKS